RTQTIGLVPRTRRARHCRIHPDESSQHGVVIHSRQMRIRDANHSHLKISIAYRTELKTRIFARKVSAMPTAALLPKAAGPQDHRLGGRLGPAAIVFMVVAAAAP